MIEGGQVIDEKLTSGFAAVESTTGRDLHGESDAILKRKMAVIKIFSK